MNHQTLIFKTPLGYKSTHPSGVLSLQFQLFLLLLLSNLFQILPSHRTEPNPNQLNKSYLHTILVTRLLSPPIFYTCLLTHFATSSLFRRPNPQSCQLSTSSLTRCAVKGIVKEKIKKSTLFSGPLISQLASSS